MQLMSNKPLIFQLLSGFWRLASVFFAPVPLYVSMYLGIQVDFGISLVDCVRQSYLNPWEWTPISIYSLGRLAGRYTSEQSESFRTQMTVEGSQGIRYTVQSQQKSNSIFFYQFQVNDYIFILYHDFSLLTHLDGNWQSWMRANRNKHTASIAHDKHGNMELYFFPNIVKTAVFLIFGHYKIPVNKNEIYKGRISEHKSNTEDLT